MRIAQAGGIATGDCSAYPFTVHILQHRNHAAATSFHPLALYFVSDASRFLNPSTSLLSLFAGWSVFLCFFLGFFGILFFFYANASSFCYVSESRFQYQQCQMRENHRKLSAFCVVSRFASVLFIASFANSTSASLSHLEKLAHRVCH